MQEIFCGANKIHTDYTYDAWNTDGGRLQKRVEVLREGPRRESFGNNIQTTLTATYKAFSHIAGNYSIEELKDGVPVNINGYIVMVRGSIIDGIARIGMFFYTINIEVDDLWQ
jgi:hypothetical protein